MKNSKNTVLILMISVALVLLFGIFRIVPIAIIYSNENLIIDFSNKISDYQIIADVIVEFHENTSDPSSTEYVMINYDGVDGHHYLSVKGEQIQMDDNAQKSLEVVCGSFDNDSPLCFIEVNSCRVIFYNSHGTFAVLYNINGNTSKDELKDYFIQSHKKVKLYKENANWYQVMLVD